MKAPDSFAEWSDLFDALKKRGNEEELTEAAFGGSFKWEPLTADLWAEEFAEVLKTRINMAQERFDRDFSRTSGSEGRMTQALIQLKKDLSFALKLTRLPCIPEEQRPLYADMVHTAAGQFAASLESSAKADRSGKTSMLVKNADISRID